MTTPKLNNITKLQRAITFLTINDCHTLDLDLTMDYDGSPKVTTEPSRITHAEELRLKRAFGPMTPSPGYSYEHKDSKGSKEYDGVKVSCLISGALSCEKYDPDELDDDKCREIIAAAKAGHISIPNCRPAKYKAEPVEEPTDDDVPF